MDNNSDTTEEEQPDSAELMYVRCAVCGAWMGVKPGQMNLISHSFCPACYAEEMRKLNRET